MNKNFHNVTIHKTAYDKARFLAKVQNKPISAVLEELLNAVFTVGCSYRKGANLSFEYDITNSTVLIKVNGSNRLVSGSFEIPESMPQEDAEKILHSTLEAKIKAKKRKGD